MKLEELQELNRRLTGLLADPQPGLMAWCDALGEVMKKLVYGWIGGKT